MKIRIKKANSENPYATYAMALPMALADRLCEYLEELRQHAQWHN
jgi:hypothetical protein